MSADLEDRRCLLRSGEPTDDPGADFAGPLASGAAGLIAHLDALVAKLLA